ncbi:MAG: hypothetical protein KZQ90_11460 [Candidatus Thiodiazotropha sp. (ex Codakia rugifera)]|nr:hypothetical protein [Candidatus Thiodiazotropha sp. (ex Codakia rugifera)]
MNLMTLFSGTILVIVSMDYVLADQAVAVLQNNPFAKPSILEAPKRATKKESPVKEEEPLEVTAILISESMPMVIADGEIVGVGEHVSGYSLIAVKEDCAIFTKKGQTYKFLLVDSGVEVKQ